MKTAWMALALMGCVVCEAASAAQVVTDYGAVGDGGTLCTGAIQKAIDAAAAAGGGKVILPAGRYVAGPLVLQSRVEVHFEPGAVLLGSTNLSDYPPIEGRWEGIERKVYASLFTGRGLEQVSLTGQGVIDGRGAVWWEANRKTSDLRKQLGIRGREPENPPEAPLRWPRPRLINLYNCTNVLIRDLTLHDSPSWNIHPVYCRRVTVDNVTVVAPPTSPNTDGLDPDSCQDVRISNCHFDVGDDCIVIKSGYNEDGRRVGVPCENVLVNNCTFARGRGGVVIGSEMSGSVRNVVVENCVFDGTDRGLRVKTALGRGGVVEYFRASNLVMRNITDAAFSITAAYSDSQSSASPGSLPPEATPGLRHIHWSNVSVSNSKRLADLSGLENSPLEDASLRNIQATGVKAGIRCANTRGLVLEDISLDAANGPAVEIQSVADLELRRLFVPRPNQGSPVVLLKDASQALLRECRVSEGEGLFLKLTGQENSGVLCEGNRLAAGVKQREH